MAEASFHPTDAMQDALHGRLDADGQAAFDDHLASCGTCRREYDALKWTKAAVARTVRGSDVPSDLDARLRSVLDAEDRARAVPARTPSVDRRAPWPRPWVRWVGAAAAVVAALWIGNQFRALDPPTQAAADFQSYRSGRLSPDDPTSDPAELESRLQRAGLPFPARVFDFGMMDYQLTGGGVHRVAGRPSALFAYRGAGDLALLCQMYLGNVEELPSPDQRRSNDGIDFLVYHEGDVTTVFWQEGPVVCVLVANGDREAAIRLAFAKAVRV